MYLIISPDVLYIHKGIQSSIFCKIISFLSAESNFFNFVDLLYINKMKLKLMLEKL